MDTKECSKCKNSLPLDHFAYKDSKRRRLQSSCKHCNRAYQREHYISNKNEYIINAKRRRKEYRKQGRKFIAKIKLETPCVDCGKYFPPVAMDFDHVRGKKKTDLSGACSAGWTLTALKKEIAKCEVVCACCHRIRTFSRLPSSTG